MAPPEFKSGTRAEVASGAAQYETGAIITEQSNSKVGAGTRTRTISGQGGRKRTITEPFGGTKIFHRSVVYPTRDSSGRITGSERVLYIEKNGTYQPAAISKDGGKTFQFSDSRYPTMDGVAGADLQKDLTNGKQIVKDSDDGIVKSVNKREDVLPADRDVLIASGVNDAITEAEESLQDGSADTQSTDVSETSSLLSTETPEREGTRRSNFGNFIYPLDLGVTKQDVLKFTMLEYVPSDFNQSGQFGFSTDARQGDRTPLGTVILPIPGGIQDSNNVNWNSQSMNALEAGLAELALSGVTGGPDKFFGNLQQQAERIRGNSGELSTAAATAFVGSAAGVGGQLLTRTTGAVINPNLELLFSGPSLRQFSFKFTFTARESNESKEVARIIRFFKQGSAVQRSVSNLFLKSPHTFKIQYLYRGPGDENNNPFMNKIKECACTGVSVNYTPQNNYSTFIDGAMTSYELTLNFNELEPIFNDEYGNEGDKVPAAIGF